MARTSVAGPIDSKAFASSRAKVTEDIRMRFSAEPSFLEAGLYISYMNYCATGEGVRSCVCVAGSARAAEHIIRGKLPDYYHVGIVIASIDEHASDDVKRMLDLIPPVVRASLVEIPRGAGEYYSEFHYNLS